VRRAAEQGVAVLLVPTNTMETVENIEQVFGKTRLGQSAKLANFEALMEQHVDYERLLEMMELCD
jgi:BioD-like phosphotransacetylase family protein